MRKPATPFVALAGRVSTALVVALFLRVFFAFLLHAHLDAAGRSFLIEGDANGYWELGQRISRGQPYEIHEPPRRILRTPGFPLLLAASISVFGDQLLAARLVLAVVSTASCWLVGVLTRRITDDRSALIAVWMAAIAPLHVAIAPLILTESFFSAGVLACLCLVSALIWSNTHRLGDVASAAEHGSAVSPSGRASRRHVVGIAALAGIASGFTVLIRPSWILWIPVSVAFVTLASDLRPRQRIVAVVVLVAGFALTLFPWAYRNFGVSGHWVVTSLWSGPSLYDGLNPAATGASNMEFLDRDRLYGQLDEFEANAEYTRRAWKFAADHPARVVELAFRKAGRFLSPVLSASEVSGEIVNIACFAWYSCFVVVVLVGAAALRKQPDCLVFLVVPFGLFLLVHMVFVGSLRYRLPVELPLFVLAAVGVLSLWDKAHRGVRVREPGPSDSREESGLLR